MSAAKDQPRGSGRSTMPVDPDRRLRQPEKVGTTPDRLHLASNSLLVVASIPRDRGANDEFPVAGGARLSRY